VMTNLLSNAYKFVDVGEVRVHAWKLSPGDDIEPLSTRDPNVQLDLPARETCIVVSVEDSGTGIAETDLPFVFERFRQVGDQVTGTKRPGTGLGLPICKEIIEHHGGQIWVESRLGAGSRFLFTLRTATPFAM
jgi:signal transduction histidine kinase